MFFKWTEPNDTFYFAFGSTHLRIGVWPKVGVQALFTAGQA